MDIEDIEVFIGTGRRQDGPLGHGPEPGRAGGSSTGPYPTTRTSCVRSTGICRQRGRCWWWTSPPPSGALAVAQDMGTAVGYLPGLSMRRIADLTPGSAKTDTKDAAVIAGAARTMPHTLRAITTSDEDAAALSMLTGFDLDLARQVNQTEGRIRGQSFTQPPPSPRGVVGPWPGARHRPGPVATWTSQDRLGPGAPDRGGRRHRRRSNGAAPPGQAAHRPTRPAGRCRRPGR